LKQNRNEDKLIIYFELCGWNFSDKLKKRMNALIEASKKKVDEFRYDYDGKLRNSTNF